MVMSNVRLLGLLACLFGLVIDGNRQTAQAELRAGAALRTITPDPLLPVSGGMGPTQPAREKRGELTARALVLSVGSQRIAIVSVDLLGFPSVLGDRARALIPSIPADHVL